MNRWNHALLILLGGGFAFVGVLLANIVFGIRLGASSER